MGVEDWSSAPMYYCKHKRKVKAGEAWERGYIIIVSTQASCMSMLIIQCSVVGSVLDLSDISEKLPDTFKVRLWLNLHHYTF